MQFSFGADRITINIASPEALFAAVRGRLAAGEGFALATLNLDHLVKLRKSAAFLAAYKAHDLVVADGNPVVWLSRLARSPKQLMPGSDLVIPLTALAAQASRPIALLGSTDDALHRAAKALRQAVPGADIALCLSPAMEFDTAGNTAGQMLAELDQRGIGLCFLALGAPKQELLAARGRRLAPHVGFASVGAGLDFLAGSQTRAPRWVQRLSLEFLWRTLQSPRRMIPRYAACAAILPGLAVAAWRQGRL